jgi:hypothetical protein
MTKVVYEHECKGSARHHLMKYKHWAKLITSVDTSKTNGFAFDGEFLDVNSEHKIDVGSLVVEACGDMITLFRIEEDGKLELTKYQKNKMSALIERAAKELENTKTPKARLQELTARKEELLKELEMIDEEIKKLS